MKKFFISTICTFLCCSMAFSQSASSVLKTTIQKYKSNGVVTANYTVKSGAQTNSGVIDTKGEKFRLTSNEMKCWFDGKTMWTYTKEAGEVNITSPTKQELAMVNPYSALISLKESSHLYLAYTQFPGTYTLKFVPKQKKNEIKQVLLMITKSTYLIERIYFEMKDGTICDTDVTGYKTGQKIPESIFVFQSANVPQGTNIVDLR